MKILLTGSNGQLGRCFLDRVPSEWYVISTDSSELDITIREDVLSIVEKYKPDVIVNAAAYTAVDKAESDSQMAELVNKTGPENLAIAAKKYNSKVVHVSTDYVFDGLATEAYTENDQTNPLGIYGKTKLDGECAVSEVLPTSIIIRTAWVFSEYGNNFLKTMVKLGKSKEILGIVCDQRGCPTYAGDIASAIIQIIEANASGGIYNYCGDKEVSWFEFAEVIFKAAYSLNVIQRMPTLTPLTTEQYPTVAQRPAFSSLDTTKIKRLGVLPSDWNEAVRIVLTKI